MRGAETLKNRRQLLRGAGAVLGIGSVGGCLDTSTADSNSPDRSADGRDDSEVVVGPDNRLVFQPESMTVSVGDTVTWIFESPSHNVSCNPSHADEATLPEGAEPFSSYDGDDKYRVDPAGTVFSHTFATPGAYVYVCIPHIAHEMIGSVTVEK